MGADWIVVKGGCEMNGEAVLLEKRVEQLMLERRRLELAFAGATIADVFARNQWLDGFTLTFNASEEYEGPGQSYRCVSLVVENVAERPGAVVEDEAGPIDGDTDWYLQERLGEFAWDMEGAIFGLCNDEASVSVRVERASIAELLAASEGGKALSGVKAAVLLFPAAAERLRMVLEEEQS